MKYLISEERMVDLVGGLIKTISPNFNAENALHMTWSDGDESYEEYYDPLIKGKKGIFAKYWIWKEELELNPEIYAVLESFFGDKMWVVADWFNKEFNQDAQTVH
mgnify:CR=1 FL=1